MERKTIKVTIDQLGKAKVEANGFHGEGCTDATKAIEQALSGGSGGVERTYKEEWAQTESEDEVVQQHTW